MPTMSPDNTVEPFHHKTILHGCWGSALWSLQNIFHNKVTRFKSTKEKEMLIWPHYMKTDKILNLLYNWFALFTINCKLHLKSPAFKDISSGNVLWNAVLCRFVDTVFTIKISTSVNNNHSGPTWSSLIMFFCSNRSASSFNKCPFSIGVFLSLKNTADSSGW